MSFLGALRASASGLTSQRIRMDVIANNVANAETTRTGDGGPYVREQVVFNPRGASPFSSVMDRVFGGNRDSGGVDVIRVQQDESDPRMVYDPSHPDANEEGMVAFPNVNPTAELIDMMSANRAYSANVTVMNAAKQMAQRALEIGR